MKADTHFIIVTTLSMIMTLMFYCCLKGTNANGTLFQDIFVDSIRDGLFFVRCLLDYWQGKPLLTMNMITCSLSICSE